MPQVMTALTLWNPILEREIGKMTYAEWKIFAEKHELWWAPVATTKDVLSTAQARECGAVSADGSRIRCPVQMRS